MNKRLLYGFLLSTFLASSCTERIDVKVDSEYVRLVVDGNIAADSGTYRVALTKTADYFSNEPVPRVTGANVFISDGETVTKLEETLPGISGIYQTHPDYTGNPGKTYSLIVDLPEAIGGHTTYNASCEMRSVTTLDSIAAVFHPQWGPKGIWTIKLWAQEPGDEVNYYMFNLYRNGILITDTITKKAVAEDKFVNGSYMNGVDVVYINDSHTWETIFPGDTITLEMSGITEAYFNYISQVDRSGFNVPFFSGPPANIQGNIDNGGIGFFAAYSSSFARAVVPPKSSK